MAYLMDKSHIHLFHLVDQPNDASFFLLSLHPRQNSQWKKFTKKPINPEKGF